MELNTVQCSQCSRTAVYQLTNGILLCVEHQTMVMQNSQAAFAQNAAMINHLTDQIQETFGLVPSGSRIVIPQPVVHQAPVTYNNINVDRSVVGAINTAQVQRIDVAMDHITNGADNEIEKAIKELTEAVVVSKEDSDIKNQLIERIAFIAEQATLPATERQNSLVKMVLESVPTLLASTANLTTIWAQWSPIIIAFFTPAST